MAQNRVHNPYSFGYRIYNILWFDITDRLLRQTKKQPKKDHGFLLTKYAKAQLVFNHRSFFQCAVQIWLKFPQTVFSTDNINLLKTWKWSERSK